MAGDDTSHFAKLNVRLGRGDDSALRELLDCCHPRLERITASIFQRDFPRLQGRREVGSIVNEAYIRLAKALETTRPQSVETFFRLASHKVRQVLLDAAGLVDREAARGVGPMSIDPAADPRFDPARIALVAELHRKISELPTEQLEVFGLVYFAGLTQAKAAEFLNLKPRRVKYLWQAAIEELACLLDGFQELILPARRRNPRWTTRNASSSTS